MLLVELLLTLPASTALDRLVEQALIICQAPLFTVCNARKKDISTTGHLQETLKASLSISYGSVTHLRSGALPPGSCSVEGLARESVQARCETR